MYRTFTTALDSLHQNARDFAKRFSVPSQAAQPDFVQPLYEGIYPMPQASVLGPGRSRSFELPQYFAHMGDTKTAFFDAGQGEPIIFIHGLAANLTHWVHVAPHFSRRFRVLGLDLPGCGESSLLSTGSSVNAFQEHVIRWMDFLEIEHATIVGHSLGGMVATSLAIDHPDRIRSAVLVNPAGIQPLPLPFRIGGQVFLRDKLLSIILPRIWRGLLAQIFETNNRFTDAFYKTCEDTFDVSDVYSIAKIIDGLRDDILERNFADLLGEIRIPTYLVWGEKDRLVPTRLLHKAADEFANVHIIEIKKCGHMPNIEFPFRIIDVIEKALTDSD